MSKLSISIIPVTPFQQNCTLIWNNQSMEGVLIDPGGDAERIEAAIEEAGVKVTSILLTHGHLDHVGAAMKLRERLGVELIGPHKKDEPICLSVEKVAEIYRMAGAFQNAYPDRWLEEGEQVDIGGVMFDVYHCPGHAPGHVIFHSPELKFAHLGDVLFHGSVGRTDLPGGDHQQLMASIRDKVLPLGDETRFICGHGPGGTIGEERLNNPFLQPAVDMSVANA